MTSRQKKGIGFGVSGAAFIAAAIVMFTSAVTPDWLASIFNIAGVIAGALGFVIVTPNTED